MVYYVQLDFGGNTTMMEFRLEVIRFNNNDVIATSAYPLTPDNCYVTKYDEFIEGGGSYSYSYDFIKFYYNPGNEDHLAVYGASGPDKLQDYTYAWYDSGRESWLTENKEKRSYGGSYPT